MAVPLVSFGVGGVGEYFRAEGLHSADTSSSSSSADASSGGVGGGGGSARIEIKTDGSGRSAAVLTRSGLSIGRVNRPAADALAAEAPEEEANGVLVPDASPESLAERCLWVLGHPAKAAALGWAGRRAVLQRYTVEAQMHKYHSLYTTLAE